MKIGHIRNFSIIAHIDHGKSTLADRLLDITNTIDKRKMNPQFLDKMDLEKEKGITIKSQIVRIEYKLPKNGIRYILNLIDTPGHTDFKYEVFKSLSACEGVILVIDGSHGVESQTVAHTTFAQKNNIKIVPVINKIDMPDVNVEKIKDNIVNRLRLPRSSIILSSAKYGIGVDSILQKIIEFIPPPQGNPLDVKNSLIIDSWYNIYNGVILLVRVFSGILYNNEMVKCSNTQKTFTIQSLGVFAPFRRAVKSLGVGEVGFVCANINIKDLKVIKVGDTITSLSNNNLCTNNTIENTKPIVFSGFYTIDTKDYPLLSNALNKLYLNDSSLYFENESSKSLGFGFRCGFLGPLHMEIIKERIEREFNLDIITTLPTTKYRICLSSHTHVFVENPSDMPSTTNIEYCEELITLAEISTPNLYIGLIVELCQRKRGVQVEINSTDQAQSLIVYKIPLSQIITTFMGDIKSLTRGFATLNYNIIGYSKTNIAKVDIIINNQVIDVFSFITYAEDIHQSGREMCKRIKDNMDPQQYRVSIQAAINGKIIARETVSEIKKNVTSKCYGGDITRKKKLLENQKKGKKRMRAFGNIQLSKSFFISTIK